MTMRDNTNDMKLKLSIDGMKFNTTSHIQHYGMSHKKMRIYLFPKNETIRENIENRRNRDRNLWRKITLQIMKEYGFQNIEMTFSQKAGCACGCSPGFIVDIKNGLEMFINYKQLKGVA
jgi:hypothetical protein